MALPGDPHDAYLPRNSLTFAPMPQQNIDLPDQAEWRDVTGAAQLVLYVNELGYVDEVAVRESTLPQVIVQAAIDQFKRAVFSPGLKENQPVKSRILIEIRYQNGKS
ncbi:TonB protein C-terminal [Andreprevotia lacus DSM 23236]|uniref:TonB protein C-terminal n=1 Tax=Andreprevotia lacus DSM 23236 TaxID=1121001 RepID=A0A1W1XAT5_9NEIS|nr:energy transducer TonB [Andreprevotia lacus]SMC21145.1 TonB protein C-terminal [Andreprevotia lacus DSM 23236]